MTLGRATGCATAPSGVGRNGRTVSALGLRTLAMAGFAGAAWLLAGAAAHADATEPAPADLPTLGLLGAVPLLAAPEAPAGAPAAAPAGPSGVDRGRAPAVTDLQTTSESDDAPVAMARRVVGDVAGLVADTTGLLAAGTATDPARGAAAANPAVAPAAADPVTAALAPATTVLHSVVAIVAEPVVPEPADRTAAAPATGSLLGGVGQLVTWATGAGTGDPLAAAPPAGAAASLGDAVAPARDAVAAAAARSGVLLTSTDRTGVADAAGPGGHMHRTGATRSGGSGSDEEPTRMPRHGPVWMLPGAGPGAPTTASGAHGDGGVAAVIPVSAADGAAQARPLPPGAEVAVLRMRAQDRTFSPD